MTNRKPEIAPTDDSLWANLEADYGPELVERVKIALGGLEIKFPKSAKTLPNDHFLIQRLGREDAIKVAYHACGVPITIPFPNGKRQSNAQRVLEAVLAGKTTNEIADRLGIHARSVRRIKGVLKSQGRLPDDSPEALREAIIIGVAAGKNIPEIAAETGRTEDDVQAAMKELTDHLRQKRGLTIIQGGLSDAP